MPNLTMPVMAAINRMLVLAGLLLLLGSPVSGQVRDGALTLDEAVALVRRESGGRVVDSVTRRNTSGRVIYEIRVLGRDGRVRTWRVDAATGQVE